MIIHDGSSSESEELEGSDSSPSSEEESSDDSSEKDSDGGSLLKFHVQHSGSKKSSACGGPLSKHLDDASAVKFIIKGIVTQIAIPPKECKWVRLSVYSSVAA